VPGLLLIHKPREDERLSWPGDGTVSRRVLCVERIHGSVHGCSGEPRRRRTLPASQLRQPDTRYRGTCLLTYFFKHKHKHKRKRENYGHRC